MGTREWSSCSGLPGYRYLENPDDRQEIADFWGIDPEFLPKKRGLQQTDIFSAIETGEIKGLWLVATNPMTSMPNTGRIRKILEKLDFLIVQDVYSDVETNQYAHVYLPASVWSEKEGCHTNTERRVNLISKIMPYYANSQPDLWIFNEMAKRFNNGNNIHYPEHAEGVFDEMKYLSRGKNAYGEPRTLDISGMSYEKIVKARGIQWPYSQEMDEALVDGKGNLQGEPRLYTDGKFQTANGRANLIPVYFYNNNEQPCQDYPFWLNSGRVVEHFHTRTRTGKIGNCNKFSPTPYMEMNPDAAKDLGVKHMGYVRLTSRRGDSVVMVQLTQRVPRNMVFVPFHYHDCVNRLTLGLLDPYSRQPAFKQCSVRIEVLDAAQQIEAAQLNVERREF